MEKLVIVWLGWWGYTAWIYAARYGLAPTLIWELDGWLITESPYVYNFPGYVEEVSGNEIMADMKWQLQNYPEAKILNDRIKEIKPINEDDLSDGYKIHTTFHGIIETKALLLSIGTEKNKLWVPWEEEFFGKWVWYCATCDWFFYKDKTVAVIGWWDTALIEASYLSDICQKVYLIHRRTEFRAEKAWVDRVQATWNIEIIKPAVLTEIVGQDKVSQILLSKSFQWDVYKPDSADAIERIDVDGVFIAIWIKPNPMPTLEIKRDKWWYIIVDEHMQTNLPWVFAAGDCTTWSAGFRQLVTACAEWAIAAESAFKYIAKLGM